MENPSSAPEPAPKPKLPPKLASLVETYGQLAIGVFFALSLLKWAVAVVLIFAGVKFETHGTAATAASIGGKLLLAWAVTRPLVLPQIAATVALTPIVARGWQWWQGRRGR